MTQTTQRRALQDRLVSIDAQEATAQALLGGKSIDLALAPNDKKLQDEVASLERELAGYTSERQRITLALAELDRRDSAEGRRQRLKAAVSSIEAVNLAGRRAAKVAAELVKHAEAMGPLLSELDTLMGERGAHVRRVLAELPATEKHRSQTYANAADWRRGVISPALAAALWRAGLGRLGPDVSPWLTITSVRDGKTDPYLKQDLRTLLDTEIERADERLAWGLRAAVQSLEAKARG